MSEKKRSEDNVYYVRYQYGWPTGVGTREEWEAQGISRKMLTWLSSPTCHERYESRGQDHGGLLFERVVLDDDN